jgi:hypothetical protein
VTTYIYALTDPDGTPRYVGQSNNPKSRLASHLSSSASPAVKRWVESLREAGELPRLTILYRVPRSEKAGEAEKLFIGLLGTVNPLLNATVLAAKPTLISQWLSAESKQSAAALPVCLAALRARAKLSCRELSLLSGLATKHVLLLELTDRDHQKVSATTLQKLAQTLGCSIQYLWTGVGIAPTDDGIAAAVAVARERLSESRSVA